MNFDSQYFSDAQKIIMGVLKEARPELLANHGKITHELKGDESIVTRLDKELEVKLKDALRNFDDKVGFWGEEYGKEGNTESFWLIDPIDGTESFTRGLPGCRNILTFINNDEPQYALIYRFTTDDLFIAEKGKPTTKNGQPVKLSDRPLKRSWIEFSVNIQLPEGYKVYQKLRPKIAAITVHRDFLEVLEGSLEGIVVYMSDGGEWDYAPRALLIAGAGGRVANVGSDKYDYRNKSLVASGPQIFDELHKLLSSTA